MHDHTQQEMTTTAETVLARRYYLKDDAGQPVETWETLCRRVADAVAMGDGKGPHIEELRKEFFRLI